MKRFLLALLFLFPVLAFAQNTGGQFATVSVVLSGSNTLTINANGAGTNLLLQAPSVPSGTDTLVLAGANNTLTGTNNFTGTLEQNGNPITGGQPSVSVRQTVMGGPVDSTTNSGLPTFLPATSTNTNLTTQNISGSAPFVVTSADGFNSGGASNSIGTSTGNLTWSNLAVSTTNYLYVNVSGGSLTTGSTTNQPIYETGGPTSTNNGQFTFLINSMTGYMGNGSSVSQANDVFVGEAITNTTGVTTTTPYAYNGIYQSPWTATLPSAAAIVSANHNIGVSPIIANFIIQCTTANEGYSPGQKIIGPGTSPYSGVAFNLSPYFTYKTVEVTIGAVTAFYIMDSANGTFVQPTAADWEYGFTANRGW